MNVPREYCRPGINIMLAHLKWSITDISSELENWVGPMAVISDYQACGETRDHVALTTESIIDTHEERGTPLLIAARDPRILGCIDPLNVPEENWYWYDENGAWLQLPADTVAEIRARYDAGLLSLSDVLGCMGYV